MVGQEQCESAGCCYDSNLDVDVIEWHLEGLGYTNNMYRCFVKKNPLVAQATAFGSNDASQKTQTNTLINTGDKVAGDPTSGKKEDRRDYSALF